MLERVYEEQFSIASEWYQIQKYWTYPDKNEMFRLYHRTYTVLCESKDIEECRLVAHAHALDRVKKLIEGHKIAADFYEGLAADLGDKSTGLDKFRNR